MKLLTIEIKTCQFVPCYDVFDDEGRVVGQVDEETALKESSKMLTHGFLKAYILHGQEHVRVNGPVVPNDEVVKTLPTLLDLVEQLMRSSE